MGSFNRPRVFDPLDLETIDRVHEATWASFVAGGPLRDMSKDDQRQELLRKWPIAFAGPSPVDFDTLCDKALLHWTPSPGG